MRSRSAAVLLPIAVIACMTAACGGGPSAAEVPLGRESTGSGGIGDPSEGFATLRESKRVVDRTMKSAARTLVTDGLTVQNAIGGATACASAPTEAAEYTAYARLVGGSGQLESRLSEAADRLVAAGWEIEERRGAPDPAYRLSEGPEAALGIGPDVQPGGSAITFSVKGPCLRIEGPGLAEFADEELDLG